MGLVCDFCAQSPPPITPSGDPRELLPQLLDQLISLGETARQLRLALGKNGRRPPEAAAPFTPSAPEAEE